MFSSKYYNTLGKEKKHEIIKKMTIEKFLVASNKRAISAIRSIQEP